MPTGLNNEHLTRKAFDYHHHGHTSLVFPGAHFAHIFALSRGREREREREREGRREDTEYVWNQLSDRPARRTSVYPAPRISSRWESWCASNNYHVNHKGDCVVVQSRPPLCNPIDCSISHQASLSFAVSRSSLKFMSTWKEESFTEFLLCLRPLKMHYLLSISCLILSLVLY